MANRNSGKFTKEEEKKAKVISMLRKDLNVRKEWLGEVIDTIFPDQNRQAKSFRIRTRAFDLLQYLNK